MQIFIKDINRKKWFDQNFPLIITNKIMNETQGVFQSNRSIKKYTMYATADSLSKQTGRNNPEDIIFSKGQYRKLYDRFLCNNKKMRSVLHSSKQKKQQQAIKSLISKSLNVRKKNHEFQDKFGAQYKINRGKPIMTMINQLHRTNNKIGQTIEQKKIQHKNLFFSQTRKVLKLEEQCMLLEYYYKDKNGFKENPSPAKKQTIQKSKLFSAQKNNTVNIEYLRNRNVDQSRHNRFLKSESQKKKLFLTHNEDYFQKIKKIDYIKQEKFKTETFKKAQLNYMFKREKNFAEMEQIIKQNRQNLLLESNTQLNSQQIAQKQVRFNRYIRFFLKFAYIEQTKRSYYDYIDEEGIEKLTRFITENNFIQKLSHKHISEIVQKITKYKIQTRLELYDFIEFFQRIQEKYDTDLMLLITQKYPAEFMKAEQKIINQNGPEIRKQIVAKQYKFVLKLMFESSEGLVLSQFLPVKRTPRTLSNNGVSGNDIARSKLFQFMYWNQKRPEGLNFEQFYFSFLMLGVKNNSCGHIIQLFQKIKLKQLLE